VILANGTPLVAALQRESRTIPIVFASLADPIGSGFVASLPRPGGNLTGVMLYEASVSGKWLAMHKRARSWGWSRERRAQDAARSP
jgi:putative ABC transport system substrate-binding protein